MIADFLYGPVITKSHFINVKAYINQINTETKFLISNY